MDTDWNRVRETFRQIWGYDDFRAPQDKIVRCLLNAQDAVIVLPTGGGKSICFQLPALLQSGLTLVVSPLVALMENQVQELRQKRLPAALLHSELPSYQRRQILQTVEKQQIRLLYLSPETLLSRPVWERLASPQLQINGLILDEAHCLFQWGTTFRPAYQRLGAVRPALLKQKPPGTKIAIAAFTATAAPTAQKIIQETLQLKAPAYFLTSPYRSNLNLQVQIAWTPRGRRRRLLRFIEARGKQSGLVYVRSRRESEALSQWLSPHNTAAYHAGLDAQERRQIEADWLAGKTQVVVCTSAFGMGINHPNVRWVAHFQAPLLLSEYLQEIGRGGRDGKRADALTLISEPTGWLDPEDKQRNRSFTDKVQAQIRLAQKMLHQLPRQGEVDTVSKIRGGDIALALLHRAGQLEWHDPFYYRRTKDSARLTELEAAQQQLQTQMSRYLRTRQCRWQFLLDAFGFKREAAGMRCGHCDNCRT